MPSCCACSATALHYSARGSGSSNATHSVLQDCLSTCVADAKDVLQGGYDALVIGDLHVVYTDVLHNKGCPPGPGRLRPETVLGQRFRDGPGSCAWLLAGLLHAHMAAGCCCKAERGLRWGTAAVAVRRTWTGLAARAGRTAVNARPLCIDCKAAQMQGKEVEGQIVLRSGYTVYPED